MILAGRIIIGVGEEGERSERWETPERRCSRNRWKFEQFQRSDFQFKRNRGAFREVSNSEKLARGLTLRKSDEQMALEGTHETHRKRLPNPRRANSLKKALRTKMTFRKGWQTQVITCDGLKVKTNEGFDFFTSPQVRIHYWVKNTLVLSCCCFEHSLKALKKVLWEQK